VPEGVQPEDLTEDIGLSEEEDGEETVAEDIGMVDEAVVEEVSGTVEVTESSVVEVTGSVVGNVRNGETSTERKNIDIGFPASEETIGPELGVDDLLRSGEVNIGEVEEDNMMGEEENSDEADLGNTNEQVSIDISQSLLNEEEERVVLEDSSKVLRPESVSEATDSDINDLQEERRYNHKRKSSIDTDDLSSITEDLPSIKKIRYETTEPDIEEEISNHSAPGDTQVYFVNDADEVDDDDLDIGLQE